jgi:hypothetical protein
MVSEILPPEYKDVLLFNTLTGLRSNKTQINLCDKDKRKGVCR